MAMLIRAAALACCYVGALAVQSRLPSEDLQVSQQISHRSNTPTIAVAIQVYGGELPYLASFLQHYARIGVDRVHLLVTREEDYPSVDAFVNESSFNVPIQLISTMFDWWGKESERSVNEKFTEDFIIYCDADEYLMIPPSKLVASHPDVDVFFFPWFVSPYDGLQDKLEAPFAGYPAAAVKYMVRRSAVKQYGCHSPEEMDCGARACRNLTTDTSLMHFNYRGLVDAAIKSCAKGGKTGNCQESFDAGDLPGRMKTLALAKVLAERHGAFRSPDKTWQIPTFFVNKTLEHEVMLNDFDFTKYDFEGRYTELKQTLSDPVVLKATLIMTQGNHLETVYAMLADKPLAFFVSLKLKSDADLKKLFEELHATQLSDETWSNHVRDADDIVQGRLAVSSMLIFSGL
eukprot:TRINITY_DN205_c0_g1_i3.p1 TRINITY_DN205_c0_g1~~TRINITY_DN205_c0_g1_i3.p1  ORF type:complete len:403 (+),score=60.82 TRINITY_DN205_c0_g1_i3:84-1292(+)